MQILFIHQNFPAQFVHLAPALARRGHEVFALTLRKDVPINWQGISVTCYDIQALATTHQHPWVTEFQTKVIRGEAALRAMLALQKRGVNPDIVVAHPGWGEALFVRQVWPHCKLGLYAEFFYQSDGTDMNFDPEFPSIDQITQGAKLHLKNAHNLLQLQDADALLSPTEFQANTFPQWVHDRISVIHDGIDTHVIAPNAAAHLKFTDAQGVPRILTRSDEVITFVNRNLEPYRGYHTFMRALPDILRQRSNAQCLIVGGDEVSYGAKPNFAEYGNMTWKDIFLNEAKKNLKADELTRIHFMGRLSRHDFTSLLQISTVHIYLTYPFVLSWSLLEAMSAGCAIVASDTAPVKELITHEEHGILVSFFDPKKLSDTVVSLLGNKEQREQLGNNARSHIKAHYDFSSHCLPKQIEWVEGLNAR